MHDGNREVCWEWDGAHGVGTRGEYRPRVRIGRTHHYVYRIVYELFTGRKPEPHEVIRHSCDHSWCCNPYHIVAGTQLDNVHDMLIRERVGMKLYHVKKIMEMHEIGATSVEIAQQMKQLYDKQLDVSTIRKIKMRTIYKHIEWPWGDAYAAQRRTRLRMLRGE